MPPTDESDALPKTTRRARGSRLSYHARRCSVCRHPEREMIDQEFLHWSHVATIAATYQIERRAIYRHAHATGLFRRRKRGLRFALGHIIEQAQTVEVTADAIIRAVKLFACLNDDGEWVSPPKRVIYQSRESAPSPSLAGTRQGSAKRRVRSTHPVNLNTSQLVENTTSRLAQIDTNSQA